MSLSAKKEKAALIRELLGIPSYYYDASENLMRDETDKVIHDIFSIVSPNTLFMFKMKKHDMLVFGLNKKPVELLYPENTIDYEGRGLNDRNKIQVLLC
jgi:hypothetical protein